MIVMMIAITPSLNASKRPLVICASFIGVNAKSDENANALGEEVIPCFQSASPDWEIAPGSSKPAAKWLLSHGMAHSAYGPDSFVRVRPTCHSTERQSNPTNCDKKRYSQKEIR